MRKPLIALTAASTIAIATVATPTTADARWGWWGPAIGGLVVGALIGAALTRPYYAYPYYGYGYGYGYAPAYYGYYARGPITATTRDLITATAHGATTHAGVISPAASRSS
jgi:hypothetical protein